MSLHRQATELRRTNEQLRAEMARREQAEASLQKADEQLSLIATREAERWGLPGFISASAAFRKIHQDLLKLHQFGSDTHVLITGESGTGKELIARAVHYGSARAKEPFVAVNCSAIPGELAESTLFGHIKGAFTGAAADRKGYFEQADGGSLFLDEVGDMPLELQAKLLRVLETNTVTPLGGASERRVNVRVIAATNAELQSAIATGKFRRDLYFRLARFTVEVPPLRERREDIPLLADFLRVLAAEMGMPKPDLTSAAMAALEQHDYYGNVRELKNLIERALIETGGGEIGVEHPHFLSDPARADAASPATADRAQDPSDTSVAGAKSTAEERILAFVHVHGAINNSECRDLLGVGVQRACYLLRKLHLAGQLQRDSSRRWAQYRLPPVKQ